MLAVKNYLKRKRGSLAVPNIKLYHQVYGLVLTADWLRNPNERLVTEGLYNRICVKKGTQIQHKLEIARSKSGTL